MTELQKRAQEVGFHQAALEAGATITDGPVPQGFTQGWGHAISFKSRAMTAHYWTREAPSEWIEAEMMSLYGEHGRGAAFVVSACGLRKLTTKSVPLLTAGNLPYCVRCENKLMKNGGR